jgi:branched-chain amino acid transport system substrate-binding protein
MQLWTPLLLGFAFSLTAGRAACETAVDCPNVVSRCIQVGLTAPLTGWASAQGLAAKRGAVLWATTVNSDGGLQVAGVAKFVELLVYDDGSSSGTTATRYEELISVDGVDFLLGPYGTSFSAAAVAIAAEHGRVIFLGNAAGDSAYEVQPGAPAPSWPHVFGVVTTSSEYTTPTARVLHEVHNAQTAAVLSRSDNAFAADTAAGALAAFGSLDSSGDALLDVVLHATFAGDVTDDESVGTGMASVCATNPDTLWLFGLKGDANALLLALAALRGQCQPKAVYISSGPTEAAWVAAANELVDEHGRSNLADLYHILSAAQWVEPAVAGGGPADDIFGDAAGFRYRMEAFFTDVNVGDDIHHHAASAAAAGIALGKAISAAAQAQGATLDANGFPSQEAVGLAASELDLSTFYGEIRFDSRGRNIAKGTVTTQVQSGNIVPVAPAEHAVSPLALAEI